MTAKKKPADKKKPAVVKKSKQPAPKPKDRRGFDPNAEAKPIEEDPVGPRPEKPKQPRVLKPDGDPALCNAKKALNSTKKFFGDGTDKHPDKLFCRNTAGWGTDHPGAGRCKFHGGNTPSHVKAAAKIVVKKRMEEAVKKNTYGDMKDIGPHEALLMEVQRTAGHVEWLGVQIAEMEKSDLTQYTAKDGMKMSEWLNIYQEERKMLVAVCRVAIGAGVAERRVKIAEEQGKMIAMIFSNFLQDARLDLTPTQRSMAPKIIGQLMREIEPPKPAVVDVASFVDVEGEELPA